MPELPEVQKTVTDLSNLIIGKTIQDSWSDYTSDRYEGKNEIKNEQFFKKFKKEVKRAKIIGVSRRGKNILIDLDNNLTIHVHLKMTGHLLYGAYTFSRKNSAWSTTEPGPLEDPFNQFIHFVITFTDGTHLVMSDMRKFGKITFFKTEETDHHLNDLGPEIFDKKFTAKDLKENLLKRPSMKIKTALMNQELIVGVGNIYSDEALFLSKIHPETPVQDIESNLFSPLLKNLRKVMEKGVDLVDKSRSDYRIPTGEVADFKEPNHVYRRTGNCCAHQDCLGIIERKTINGRTGHFCPTCQRIPKAQFQSQQQH